MDIAYRPIATIDVSNRTLAFINSYNCILANHMWHADYDEHDGYPGSDLCQENESALFFLTKIIDENKLNDQTVDVPFWMWMALGAVADMVARWAAS